MFTSFRHYRQFYNRRVSIILAILIGVLLGVGAFLIWQRGEPPAQGPGLQGPSKSEEITAAGLISHKALYRVDLAGARSGSQIIDIQGRMFFESKGACDNIITDHRFYLTYDYADSVPMRVTSDFSTAERADGQYFSFSSRRRRDGELYQELRGTADLTRDLSGKAVYALPEDMRFDLGAGTLFPAGHTAALIRAAEKGRKFLSATLFDGSDEEGPVQVSAVIGAPFTNLSQIKGLSLKSAGKSIDPSLLPLPAWPIRLAFFPASKDGGETADYELTMVLHKNGVISDMTIDYSDFSVDQHLTALQKVASDPCGAVKEEPPPSPSKTIPDLPPR